MLRRSRSSQAGSYIATDRCCYMTPCHFHILTLWCHKLQHLDNMTFWRKLLRSAFCCQFLAPYRHKILSSYFIYCRGGTKLWFGGSYMWKSVKNCLQKWGESCAILKNIETFAWTLAQTPAQIQAQTENFIIGYFPITLFQMLNFHQSLPCQIRLLSINV